MKQGSWVDKIAYDGEGAELIRVKTMDGGLGKDLVAFGLKLGICSDSMEFECMDLVAEEGCAGMDSQYRGRKKAQKEKRKTSWK